MANNDQALSETTIKIEWDREAGQARWRIKNMTHQEALFVLLDVIKNCVGFALGETHHHEEAADDH
jgi:hypothetical protein